MRIRIYVTTIASLLLSSLHTHGQWVTQDLSLAPGWNGVFLHVTPESTTLQDVVNLYPEIQEIWLWEASPSVSQFLVTPDLPADTGSQWMSWKRTELEASSLANLIGNAAYLVRVSDPLPDEANTYSWSIKGRPIPPSYQWTSTGLNFIGFSTPSSGAPDFEALSAKSAKSRGALPSAR